MHTTRVMQATRYIDNAGTNTDADVQDWVERIDAMIAETIAEEAEVRADLHAIGGRSWK